MTYEEAVKKLESFGQMHVLKYYEELTDKEKESLLAQIDRTDFSLLENVKLRGKKQERGEFAPLAAMELPEIEANKERFFERGKEALQKGEVACCLLAGGMGTRLGSDNPKGMYDIGLTKPVYIFQRLIENLQDVERACGATPRLFIMTSEKNHEATVSFLKEHAYFGYPEDRITFFSQDMAPACDYDGKVFMESKAAIATSPNGNAGWYSSLCKAGLHDLLEKEGIKWINIFAVDNVLQRMADPVFIGATLDRDVECGAKCVRKAAPDEGVGVICLEDGRPSIVEYYDESEEMRAATNEKGEPAYNFGVILNYLFSVQALDRVVREQLPLHVVEKKIAHIDENAVLHKPDKPNGCKFETLVLDMIHEMNGCLAYEVVRSHEFAPIKNKTGIDSVESARELCKLEGIVL